MKRILVVTAVLVLSLALSVTALADGHEARVRVVHASPDAPAVDVWVNGAVAFGAALAGGAIAGPIGAFMSLPVAALITAIVKNSGARYDVVYRIKYADEGTVATDSRDGDAPGGTAATIGPAGSTPIAPK